MKYIIDEKNSIFAYLQLYHYFRDVIIQDVFPFKNKLPSKRITCAETGLNVIIVEHAYELLIQKSKMTLNLKRHVNRVRRKTYRKQNIKRYLFFRLKKIRLRLESDCLT